MRQLTQSLLRSVTLLLASIVAQQAFSSATGRGGAFSAIASQPSSFEHTVELSYPSPQNPTADGVLINFRPNGPGYRLSLQPSEDTKHHVVVVSISALPDRRDRQVENVLDPVRNTHGYQNYTFAASDFRNGPQKSLYGRVCLLDVKSIGAAFRVVVKAADTTAEILPDGQTSPAYFKQFKVDVSYK